MKKLLLLALCFIALNASAQTAKELMGKWKLVKWTSLRGKDKKIKDSTYQVFNDEGKFVSISEGKIHNGKWKLSDDNKKLHIVSGILAVDFNLDFFDAKRRVISSDKIGTLEYTKVEE